ncbi:Ran-binding protein 9, partial [Hondaea fermentalgiana]
TGTGTGIGNSNSNLYNHNNHVNNSPYVYASSSYPSKQEIVASGLNDELDFDELDLVFDAANLEFDESSDDEYEADSLGATSRMTSRMGSLPNDGPTRVVLARGAESNAARLTASGTAVKTCEKAAWISGGLFVACGDVGFPFRLEGNKSLRAPDDDTENDDNEESPTGDLAPNEDEDDEILYFEVRFSRLEVGSEVAIGLELASTPDKINYPGWNPGSWALHSSGRLFAGSAASMAGASADQFCPQFAPNDVIGCGWDPCKRHVFFTRNGKLLGVAFKIAHGARELDAMPATASLFPVLGIRSPCVHASVNFGDSSFCWDSSRLGKVRRARPAVVTPVHLKIGRGTSSNSNSRASSATSGGSSDASLASLGKTPSGSDHEVEAPRNPEGVPRTIDRGLGLNMIKEANEAPSRRLMRSLRRDSSAHQQYSDASASLSKRPLDMMGSTALPQNPTAPSSRSASSATSASSPSSPRPEDEGLAGRSGHIEKAVQLTSKMSSRIQGLLDSQASSTSSLHGSDTGTLASASTAASRGAKRDALPRAVSKLSSNSSTNTSDLGAITAANSLRQVDLALAPALEEAVEQEVAMETTEALRERLEQLRSDVTELSAQLEVFTKANSSEVEALDEASLAEEKSILLRHRIYNLICETPDDAILGDLLELQDALLTVIDHTSLFRSRVEAGLPPVSAEEASKIFRPTESYSMSKGLADSTQELLCSLRGGTEQAQLNAARALAYLVRDGEKNAEIRTWSRMNAYQEGAMSTLSTVLASARCRKNLKLKHAVATAIVAIVSGSWVSTDSTSTLQTLERSATSSNSSGSSTRAAAYSRSNAQRQSGIRRPSIASEEDHPAAPTSAASLSNVSSTAQTELDPRADPRFVAKGFLAELPSIIRACGVLVRNDCFCCDAHSWKHGRKGCVFTMREASLAVANLCMILAYRDSLRLSTGAVLPIADPEDAIGEWVHLMAESATPLLMEICLAACPDNASSHRATDDGDLDDEDPVKVWREARQFAVYSISVLCQYTRAHQVLLEENVLEMITTTLGAADDVIVYHATRAVFWLSAAAAPRLVCDISGADPFAGEDVDLVTVGWTVGQLVSCGAVAALFKVVDRENLPPATRSSVAAALAILSSLGPCERKLLELDAPRVLGSLAGHCLAGVVPKDETGGVTVREQTPPLEEKDGSGPMPMTRPSMASAPPLSSAAAGGDGTCSASLLSGSDGSCSSLSNRANAASEVQGVMLRPESVVQGPVPMPMGSAKQSKKRKHGLSSGGSSSSNSRTSSNEDSSGGPSTSSSEEPDGILGVIAGHYQAGGGDDALSAETRERREELRYLAATFMHICNAVSRATARYKNVGSGDALPWKVVATHARALTRLCRSQDDLITFYTLQAVFQLSKLGRDACEALAKQSVARVMIRTLRLTAQAAITCAASDTPDIITARNEVRLAAASVLGNLANASPDASTRVALAGGIEYALETLRHLFGIPESIESASSRHLTLCDPPGAEIEVAHQAVRLLSGFYHVISRNLAIPKRWDRIAGTYLPNITGVVATASAMLNYPVAVIQMELCRLLASVAECPGSEVIRPQMIQSSLRGLLGLLNGESDGSLSGGQFQESVEDVLIALGFEDGIDDVILSGNSPELLRTWGRIQASLEFQTLAGIALKQRGSEYWDSPTDAVHQAAKEVSAHSAFAVTLNRFLAYQKDAPSYEPPLWLRGLVGTTTTPTPSDEIDQQLRIISERYITSWASHLGFILDHSAFGPLHDDAHLGLDGIARSMPSWYAELLKQSIPNLLERRRFLFPYAREGHRTPSSELLLPELPLHITIPSSRHLTKQFSSILQKVLASHSVATVLGGVGDKDEPPAQEWALCVRECTKCSNEHFFDNLLDCLRRFPSITSLTLIGPTDGDQRIDTKVLAKLVRFLPDTVQWLTFDNLLCRGKDVALIAKAILTRRTISLSLAGLSIRESGLSGRDLNPILHLLQPPTSHHEGSALPPKLRVRWLDLSGNNLTDAHCAAVLDAISTASTEDWAVRGIDLSNNAVLGFPTKMFQTLFSDEGKPLLGSESCPGTLHELHMGNMPIGSRAASALFRRIATPDSRLRALGLGGCRLSGDNVLVCAVVELLERGTHLQELDLSENMLGEVAGKEICLALRMSCPHYIGLHGCKGLRQSDRDLIDETVRSSRRIWAEALRAREKRELLERAKSEFIGVNRARSQGLQQQQQWSSASALPSWDMDPSFSSPSGSFDSPDAWANPSPTSGGGPSLSGSGNGDVMMNPMVHDMIQDERDGFRPRLSVLFSIPLVHFGPDGQPMACASIEYEAERHMLMQTFQDAKRDINLSFGFATMDRLRSEVTLRSRAIHYSGHGSRDALLFEDQIGGARPVATSVLRDLAGGASGSKMSKVKLAFVSACHSEFAGQAFIDAGVPHVVCVKVAERIQDTAAQAFTRWFYLELAIGGTVRKAFDVATQAVRAQEQARVGGVAASMAPSIRPEQASKFLLLPKDANHDVPIFPGRAELKRWPSGDAIVSGLPEDQERQEERRRLWWGSFVSSALPKEFLGRNVQAYDLLAAIMTRRIVSCTGTSGIGKLSLASFVVNYALRRGNFPQGAILIRANEMSSVSELVKKLRDRTIDPHSAPPAHGTRSLKTASSSLQGDSSAMDMEEVYREQLFELLRYRKFLLLLSGCDNIDSKDPSFRTFLGRLSDEVEGLCILMTSSKSIGRIPGYTVTNLKLRPLHHRDAALLFLRLALSTRLCSPSYIAKLMSSAEPPREKTANPYTLLDAIGEHPFLKPLAGNPRQIMDETHALTPERFTTIIEQCQLVIANTTQVVRSKTTGSINSSASPSMTPQ